MYYITHNNIVDLNRHNSFIILCYNTKDKLVTLNTYNFFHVTTLHYNTQDKVVALPVEFTDTSTVLGEDAPVFESICDVIQDDMK